MRDHTVTLEEVEPGYRATEYVLDGHQLRHADALKYLVDKRKLTLRDAALYLESLVAL